MRVAVYQGEQNIAQLAERLYLVKRSKRLISRVELALTKFNPHLGDLSRVPAGTLIFVPDVPGIEFNAESSPGPLPGFQLLDEAKRLSTMMDEVFRAAADRAGIEAQQAEMLKQMANEFARLDPILAGRAGGTAATRPDWLGALASMPSKNPETASTGERTEGADG